MRKTIIKLSGLALTLGLFSTGALADPMAGTYEAGNAGNHCGAGAIHGLWTNGLVPGGNCTGNYFGVDGLTLELTDDGGGGLLGFLNGSVASSAGWTAVIDVDLTDWLDDLTVAQQGDYKGGGGPYDGLNQDFFETLTGTITVTDAANIETVYTVSALSPTFVQLGIGANDKDAGIFGISTWLDVFDPAGQRLNHWDINLTLTEVPEPATLALLGLGLMGMGAARRRRQD